MKINYLIFMMLAFVFLNGCATTHNMELTAVASPDQKTDPYGAVVSEKMHMVSISTYKEISFMRDTAIFNIIVENGGEEPLIIGKENISVIFEGHDKKRTVKKLDTLSAREFMQDVVYEYGKTGTYYLNQIVHSGGSSDDFITIFPSASSPIIDSRAWKVKSTMNNIKTLRETLPDLIFDQKTIMPRESITALVSFRTSDIPRRITGDLKINVSIDGEEHGFTFARK